MNKFFVSVDIGGTKISLCFFKQNTIIKKKKFRTYNFGPSNLTHIRNYLKNNFNNITKIGIATTGLIYKNNWSVLNKKMIGSFENFPIVDFFRKDMKIPTFAIGDTHAASLGELHYGNGRKLKNFFYITVSTGIGGSAIINGNVLNSSQKIVGQIGHTVIKNNGKLCGCGRKGCLEAYSSGTAIEKKINQKLKLNLSLKEIIKYHNKNKIVIDTLNDATLLLSESIINIHNILGINNFIIGGSVGLNDIFFKKLNLFTFKKNNEIKLIKAGLRNNAESYGCLAYSKLKK